nr:hypothetical protein [Tanacetum cinerariifolium]
VAAVDGSWGWWCGAVGSGVGMVVTVGGSGCCHGDLVAATMVWLEVAAWVVMEVAAAGYARGGACRRIL